MKLIIAGTRTLELHLDGLDNLFRIHYLTPLEIVSGGAKGIDSVAIKYAKEKNISLKVMNADWNAHGKAAGPIRNREMAKYADALLLIWDGKSRGSANMKSEMLKLNKLVYEVIV